MVSARFISVFYCSGLDLLCCIENYLFLCIYLFTRAQLAMYYNPLTFVLQIETLKAS